MMSANSDTLPSELADELRRRVFDEPGFMRLVLVMRRGGTATRDSLRPVQLKGDEAWQAGRVAGGRTTVRNLDPAAARESVAAMLAATGARELHLVTASGDLHLRITSKGRLLLSRSKPLERAITATPPHDHEKRRPLAEFDASPLLRVLGMTDGEGRLRAAMRAKHDQIDAFLRLLQTALPAPSGRPLQLVDCGCGRAYLTLAAHAYLTQALGRDVRICGIDHNDERVHAARRMASDLGCAGEVRFLADDLATCRLETPPDLLLSLHACDRATDTAIARGVAWNCACLLVAPCCQHDLQPQLSGGGAMRALLRHGILRERLADMLADTFRAQILRILGYRVRIVEFVAPEATARNILLRAEGRQRPGQRVAVAEYLALRDLWQATPALETLLAEPLAAWLPLATPALPAGDGGAAPDAGDAHDD